MKRFRLPGREAVRRFLVEALGLLPLYLLAGGAVHQWVDAGLGVIAVAGYLIGCGALGVAAAILLRGRKVWLQAMAGAAAASVLSLVAFGAGDTGAMLWAAGAVLAFRAAYVRPFRDAQTQTVLLLVSMAMHAIAYPAFRSVAWLKPEAPILYGSFYVLVLYGILHWNGSNLKENAMDHAATQAAARATGSINRRYLIGFTVLWLAAGQASFLKTWISEGGRGLLRWLASLFAGGAEEQPQGIAEQPAPPPMMEMPVAPNEPNPFWAKVFEILVAVVYYGFLALVAVLAALALYRLGRMVWRVVGRLLARLGARRPVEAVATLGYVDEEVKLERIRKRRAGRLLWHRRDGADPATDKVRDLFRRYVREAIRRGYAFQPWHTPQETAARIAAHARRGEATSDYGAELARLYGKVRYGETAPGAEELAALQRARRTE